MLQGTGPYCRCSSRLKGEDLVAAESIGGFIPQTDLDQIKARVSIDELLRDYDLQLVDSGRGRLKALCPFHNEKTPSFSVNIENQYYHCFGCQTSGNIFTFVMEYERVGFPEAVEILARKAGVSIQRTARKDDQYRKTLGLFEALDFAVDFYHRYLLEAPGAEGARQYLEKRGINREMQEQFKLGCSPAGWEELLGKATAAGHSTETLEQAGLIRQRKSGNGSGHFDEFRGKLMFPIQDAQGRHTGFGARRLEGDDDPAKYRNTRETKIFNKSRVLYGLPQSKLGIRTKKAIVVVEGYTDTIMAHQAGLDFFVASLGTAFTKENAHALKRYSGKVYMIFDGDSAGLDAAERSLELLVSEDLDVQIYPVVDGKDPCDVIAETGGEAFWESVQNDSLDILEFKWNRTIGSQEAAASPQALSRAVSEFLGLVAKISDKVARRRTLNTYIERLGLLGLRPGDLPLAKLGFDAPAPPAANVPQQQESDSGVEDSLHPLLEMVVLCMSDLPEKAAGIWEAVPAGLLAGEAGQALQSSVESLFAGGSFTVDRLVHDMNPVVRSAVIELLDREVEASVNSSAEVLRRWTNCSKDLQRWRLNDELDRLIRERISASDSGAVEQEKSLRREISGLRKELSRLRKEPDELTLSS